MVIGGSKYSVPRRSDAQYASYEMIFGDEHVSCIIFIYLLTVDHSPSGLRRFHRPNLVEMTLGILLGWPLVCAGKFRHLLLSG